MRILLIGVLLGLLQGGSPDSFYNPFHNMRPVPVVVRGPLGNEKPILYTYYSPFHVKPSHPRAPPVVYPAPQRTPDHVLTHHDERYFDRGHIEAHPFSFREAGSVDDGRIPLRDSVERIPIEGQMNILRKNSLDENQDSTPFSRGDVEALPSPQIIPYSSSNRDFDIHATVYEAQDYLEDIPLIGYRKDVESPPARTPNKNPFSAFYPGLDERFSDFDASWQHYPAVEPKPIEYTSWNSPINFIRTNGKKVVCYYESWAVHRTKPNNFDIDNIDPFACSHLIYTFASIDTQTHQIISLDPERDVVQGAYKSAVSLKQSNPALKVMIAVGGWAEGGKKFSNMVSSQANRDAFVNSMVYFMTEHGFDGLDFDWEYPGDHSRGGKSTDKDNLSLLMEQLRAAFNIRGWILSMAIPLPKSKLEGYDLMRLSKVVDFFNLMAYDLRGWVEGFADNHAPFLSKATDKYIHTGLNLNDGVQIIVDRGVQKSKIVIGVPFYGRSYTLKSPFVNGPGAAVTGPGIEGRYTKEMGYISYYEICMSQRNGGWSVKVDEAGGPYMVKGDQWIGYDDEKSIEFKVNFIKYEGFGGVMVWAIDLDDSLGLCGVRWPLLTTVRKVLYSPSSPGYEPVITQSPFAVIGETTTTKKIRKPTTPPPMPDTHPSGPEAGDPCQGSKMVPKHGNCNGFLTCNQNVFIDNNCAHGLHWNKDRNICDWPNKAKCHQAARPPPPPPVGGYPTTPEVITDPTIPKPGTVILETPPASGPLSGDFMVVCYYTNWSIYRRGNGKFSPDDIDVSTCTHIVYGFAVLDRNNLVIKPHDSWADTHSGGHQLYQKVTSLKSRGVKVTLAIGGWNDSAGNKYSRLLNNPAGRAKFIDHVIMFIKKHKFDGLDLDYEYPACPQVECDKGDPKDKAAFAAFVQELSMKFKPQGLLLSAAVSPSKKVIDLGYDVPALNQYLDWIAVMTYDFHGHWDKKTGHVAPLYHHPQDDNDYFNMDYAIRYWIKKGASPKKIVLGMPLYGQSFTLNSPTVNGLNAPASRKGAAGEFTKAAGFLAYYEICKHVTQNGWTVVKDPKGRMGPYAYKGNQWVSYDNVGTIKKKSTYIRKMGLGGGMVWALDLDDFTNTCGQGRYPLLKTIQAVLGPALDSGYTPIITDQPMRPPSGVEGTKIKPPSVHGKGDLKVVCYFTNWAAYRPGEGKYEPEDVMSELCTHINYGFLVLDERTLTLKHHDTSIDIDQRFFERVVELKLKNPNLKVLAALGGWNDSKGDKYSRLVSNRNARRRFNEHALRFLESYGFDGLDLDWEYPKCPQTACNKGNPSDKHNFVQWIKELKTLFEPKGLLLTAAVSPSYTVIDQGYDVPMLSQYLDFINVMTYDYHGQWDNKTGHFSPLYAHPGHDEPKFNVDFTINYWIRKGADPKKLIMGMGMYGQSFTLTNSYQNDLNQPTKDAGEAGPFTRARGFLAYYEICYFIKSEFWTVVRDPEDRMGPYAYKGNQWVGFDDVPMIKKKSQYILDMGLGGGMIWALDLDDFSNRCSCEHHPLLRTINRVLRKSSVTHVDPHCPLLGAGTKSGPTPSAVRATTPHYVPPTIMTPKPYPQHPPQKAVDSSVGTAGGTCSPGEFKRHSECGKFYECYKGILREVSCHRGFHWNGEGKCVDPRKTRCSPHISSPPMVQRPDIKPVEHPIRGVDGEFGAEGQSCKAGVLKKHPTDCAQFYECLHSNLRKRTCFAGLHWDGKGQCTWPNQAKCHIKEKPGIPSLPETGVQPIHIPAKKYTTVATTTTRVTTTTKRPPKTSTKWYVPWTPSTIATTPPPTHPPGPLTTEGRMVICYFTNWAWYRRGAGKYLPEHIDVDLCTHILYGFAVLNVNTLLIKPHDTWADEDNKFFQRVTSLKAKGKKVLIAIGGWNDSKGSKYSKMTNDPAARARFIHDVLEFIRVNNFDGLDLDWEYPVCWQVDCKKGPASDKDAFSAWMRELSAAFKPRNLLLSAAISPSKMVIEHAYHVPDLTKYLDFVNVMTYDYHGHWDKQTGHVAPLYHHDQSTNEYFNANYTINYLLDQGAIRSKLCMGIPMYGQAFTLRDASKPILNSSARKGAAGKHTKAAGFLSYYEICAKVKKEGYKVVKDPLGRIGPYAHKGTQWVGFDDVEMVRRKSQFIVDMNLGGGMIWALDLDDFSNSCNCEPYPLLRTINRVLRDYKTPTTPDCSF